MEVRQYFHPQTAVYCYFLSKFASNSFFMKLGLQFLLIQMLFLLTQASSLYGQRKNASYEKYISSYYKLAIEHEKKYKIPACIKLGQALLESSAGESKLAKESNNHFGIKCHTDWKGKRVFKRDDNPRDCFRHYSQVKDSYEDHSKFLAERSRYEQLFQLKITDYKGWAKGLKKCGYATDPGYADKLIGVIETYELYDFRAKGVDKRSPKVRKKKVAPTKAVGGTGKKQPALAREVFKTHGLIYVVAGWDDSIERVASDLDFKPKKLAAFNDLKETSSLRKGDLVYLQKKRKRAEKPYANHRVRSGETTHSIAQKYGIQEQSLKKMNDIESTDRIKEGDVLKLR